MRQLGRLNATPLSPLLAFTAAWIFAALLSQYHLLNGQQDWSSIVVIAVVAVPIAFIGGGLIGEGVALWDGGQASERTPEPAGNPLYRRLLLSMVVLGLLELAHQFVKIGGIPLLSPGNGALRFSQGGPTIILTDGLTVAAISALVRPRKLFGREAKFELMIALAALAGFALQAGRGSVVLPVIVAIAGRWLYRGRPRGWLLAGGALLTFAAVVFGFYLRTRQTPYNPFESELFGEILPGTPFILQPLIPIYLAITTNFLALQGVIGHFPTGEAFGHGAFDAIGANIVFHGARNVSDVSATLTPPWVTSTVAGPFWADGGFIALIPGIAATGFVSAGAFAMSTRTRSLRWSMVAAYLLYVALFGLYQNLWTQQLDWLLVVPLLLLVGSIAEDPENPPGLPGRAWVRIRQVTRRATNLQEPPRVSPPIESTQRPARPVGRIGRKLIVAGFAVVALLFVTGLLIQPLLPEPYPLLSSQKLPPSLAHSLAVMTNNDRPGDNEPIQWVRGHGHTVTLYSYTPGRPLSEVERRATVTVPGEASKSTFDVNFWPPWRAEALFSFEQRPRNLIVTVNPTWRAEGRAEHFVAPLPAPPQGTVREFTISSWGGSKPDLFVVSRGDPQARAVLQILSGESGFHRQLFAARLPYRGLSPRHWAFQLAPIEGLPKEDEQRIFRGDRLDLVMIDHDPANNHSMVHVLLGETGFEWDAVRRDLNDAGSIPRSTEFLIGSRQGATAIYEVARGAAGGPRLRTFGLTNPPALQ